MSIIITNLYFSDSTNKSIRAKPCIRARDVDLIHTKEFISWFEEHVSTFTIYIFIISNKHICFIILYLNR